MNGIHNGIKLCLLIYLAVDSLTAQVVNGVPGQQSPCLGQDIVHTCTFPSGQTTVNMEVHSGDRDLSLALTFGSLPLQVGSLLGNILIANLTSSTSAELLIVAINSALNESTVTCDTPGQSPQNLSRTVFVLGMIDNHSLSCIIICNVIMLAGLPSGPVYTYDSITQSDFESINVTVQRPVYGWECVDEYTVVAQSDPGNVVDQSISVTTPGQLLTVVPLSGLDLCRNAYSLATFATSNGGNGQSFRRPGPYLPDISGKCWYYMIPVIIMYCKLLCCLHGSVLASECTCIIETTKVVMFHSFCIDPLYLLLHFNSVSILLTNVSKIKVN